jgi:GNAT superfamily N-acetyltransferase
VKGPALYGRKMVDYFLVRRRTAVAATIGIICIGTVHAFTHHHNYCRALLSSSARTRTRCAALSSPSAGPHDTVPQQLSLPSSLLTHDDICWKLRPPADTPPVQKFRVAAYAASQYMVEQWTALFGDRRRQQQEDRQRKIVFPDTPVVVLEAWDRRQRPQQQIGRFGITVRPGPSTPELVAALSRVVTTKKQSSSMVDDNDHNHHNVVTAAAAIIYMYIEPSYRSQGIGALALQVIRYLHGNVLGCDCTILVADDKSPPPERQKLVQWYERHGFYKASELQDMMGSPNERYGVAMIAPLTNTPISSPTSSSPPFTIQWW